MKRLKKGNVVKFNNISLIEDLDLADWLCQFDKNEYEVIEVDEESRLFWIEDCEYAISFDEYFEILNTKKKEMEVD